MTQTPAAEHVVHEAFGPPLTPPQASAAIAFGVVSLLISGLLAVLLGALAEEHRLSARGIGLSAMTEALTMAITTGVAGAVLKPHRLKLIGAVSSVALCATNLAVLLVHNDLQVMAVRGLCGVPEGLLLWITIGMIARTETPDRWAGVMFTALTATQLAISASMAGWVLPKLGANGGFALIGVLSLAGAPISLWLPARYPPLPKVEGETGAPPPRGWIALAGTLLYVSAASAVAIYLVPFCIQAGLPTVVARTATSFSLAAQVLGGALATVAAGRVKYFVVFVGGVVAYGAVYLVYGFAAPAWLFIAATALSGLTAIFINPFLVPMTIEADPSRRAAVQSGAVQLLGAALGPFFASRVVSQADARGALWLGMALLCSGLAVIAWLRFTRTQAVA
ncbi:MFS transporter [Phenylobacterium montanum]|uniref:MFS transporter n=1 Tax=Phenylobacterium montanum TaxID=2823693 RepID=A0A975IUS8_9CAUL|nr:MFS transporter [Caulobacter sp. S6]QUD88065.1 MFS transporter [Caulobacter sp. S6]